MNAWGKHKAKQQQQQQTPPPDATASAPAAGAPAAGAPVDVTLMETTTETKDFSSEEIPSSVFDIPAGYKQVPNPMEQMFKK
jgi:hypothetical protein